MTRARFPYSEILGSKLAWQLPEAYRSLQRPSSASSAKASTVCPLQLAETMLALAMEFSKVAVVRCAAPAPSIVAPPFPGRLDGAVRGRTSEGRRKTAVLQSCTVCPIAARRPLHTGHNPSWVPPTGRWRMTTE
jgi:hypothetical protein